MILDLFRDQMSLGDLHLFIFGAIPGRMISIRSSSGCGMFSVLAVVMNLSIES